MRRRATLLIALAVLCILGFPLSAEDKAAPETPAAPASTEGDETLKFTSPAFEEGGTIPVQFTADGKNISPPLRWENVPDGVESFALVMDDPDAPAGIWVHWVVWNLPVSQHELAEHVPPQPHLPNGTLQGRNDFKKMGYGGPAPPPGPPHRYYFRLYALDTKLSLEPGATKEELMSAMQGHVMANDELMARYGR